MIAAVSLSTDSLPVNWFDATLIIVLGFGLFRGRKNGMTKEILPTFEWLILVAGAGLGYPFLAQYYVSACNLSRLSAALLAYMTIAFVIFLIFSLIRKGLAPRLTGSNIFGSGEYYLGMPSGLIRYFCILMFFLALINARTYTAQEIADKKAYNQRWYGGGIYSGDYVPDLHSVQEAVFKNSLSGPYIKNYLGIVLIQTGPGDAENAANAPKKPQPVIHIGN
jgi:uncharacterized membrane protein required for colicin V production